MNKDIIKHELEELLKDGKSIIEKLKSKKDKKLSFHLSYQKWYSSTLKVIQILAPDRYIEFKSFYEIDSKRKSLGYGTYVIQDYLKGVAPGSYDLRHFDTVEQTIRNVYNQYAILQSLENRIDNKLNNIEATLLIDLQSDELEKAKELIKVNIRASGVIAGVVLEGYLKSVCLKHELKILKTKSTLARYNDLLKENEVYDLTIWRKISYLGDIRNLCAHKKERDPNKEEVIELIDGVNWATKNIF